MPANTLEYQRRYYQMHREYFANWYVENRELLLERARLAYRRKVVAKAREAMRRAYAKTLRQ